MEQESCGVTGACGAGFVTRPDRPHTFFAHGEAACGECERPLEGRIVLREGQVVSLVFCTDCGQTESVLSDEPQSWIRGFLAKGRPTEGRSVFKKTTSTCPTCLDLLQVDVVIDGGQVLFEKECPKCGPSKALVSEEADYYHEELEVEVK